MKTTTTMNNDYKTMTLTMMLATTTTTMTTTTMTTMKTTTKISMATMINLAIIFVNIKMILWAALGANQWKYHGVSQLHPLDDLVLRVSTLLATGHTRGAVYVCTYMQTQYDEKWSKKMIGTILPPNGGQNIIVHGSGR